MSFSSQKLQQIWDYSRAPKSELFGLPISDRKKCPKSERSRLDSGHSTKLGHFGYKGGHKKYFISNTVQPSVQVCWLGIQTAPKSDQNHSDFGHRLITEQFGNGTEMTCPKSEQVRITALYCIFYARYLVSKLGSGGGIPFSCSS